MNAHKILNPLMVFIFSFSLLGVPAPALAQGLPTIQVWDSGRVDGMGWPQMNGSMTMTIDDPHTPQTPDFTADGPTFQCSWDPGLNCVNIPTGDFQFAVGQVITLTDVITYTKVFTITSLSMKVTEIDTQTDIVHGTADPGSSLTVAVGGIPFNRSRTVTADPFGYWQADFADTSGGAEAYDIIPGTNIYASQCDDDGDCLSTGKTLPDLWVKANFENDQIQAWGLENGSPVTLNIDDPVTGPGVDYSVIRNITPSSWDSNQLIADFQLQGLFDIRPGQVITVSGDQVSKSMTVENIFNITVDALADTVSGYINPGSSARVHAGTNVDSGNLSVDNNGYWIANLGALGVDLQPGSNGYIQADGQDGGSTWIGFQVINPSFSAIFPWNQVHGYRWPMGAQLTLTVDDPANGSGVDYTQVKTVDMQNFNPPSNTWVGFNIEGFELHAGQLVSLTDGATTKTHVVQALTVTEVDPLADTITGTATPGAKVQIGRMCDQNGCAYREVTTNASGNWLADLTSNGDVGGVQGVFDLQPGSRSDAFLADDDDDRTSYQWNVPNPVVSVQANRELIEGYNWPLGSTVMLEIDDPATPQEPDLNITAVVGVAEWNPAETAFRLYLDNYDLKQGDIVTAGFGDTQKQLLVSNLFITNVDINNDTVYGITTAYQSLRIWTCDNDPCVERVVTAGPTGNWEANLGVPGDLGSEQLTADLKTGSSVHATEEDAEGDSNRFDLNVIGPSIYARITENEVHGYDWPLGDIVSVLIEDSDPETPDFSATQTVVVSEWNSDQNAVEFKLGDFTLAPGQVITMHDDTMIISYTVANLAVTVIDQEADTVSGTANPGSELTVGHLCDETGCVARSTTTDEFGHWLVDFSVPGTIQEPDEQRLLDIGPGTGSQVHLCDDDYINCTTVSWQVPNYTFGARVVDNSLEGWQWPLGISIVVEIDDPHTEQAPDYTGQTDVYVPSWSPSETRFDLNFSEQYDLKPGDTVTVSNGDITKTHLVTNMAIIGVNFVTGTVSGIATPGSLINVWACGDNGCVNREERTDPSGNWQSNFSIPGDLDWEQDIIELKPGIWIDSAEMDEDWDQTMFGRVSGSMISGGVYAIEPVPGNEVGGVMVEACSADNTLCRTALTDASGRYSLMGLPAGTYNLRAFPPGLNLPASLGPLEIGDDANLSGQDMTLPAQPPAPPADAVEPAHAGGGTLTVYWMDALTLTTSGCANSAATFELFVPDDSYTASGSMTETPAGSGSYTASIPALYPHHGVAEITYTLACPDGSSVETHFFIYIDPSGVVKNTSGAPISGATVTLLRSDSPAGPFEPVPDGSAVMSPSNRANPMSTDANGEYGWDVVAGFYKLRAEKPGCFSPDDPAQPFVESAVLTIPPPVSGLELVLQCQAGAPKASAGGPYALNEGGSILLDASGSSDPDNDIVLYTWDLDTDGQFDDASGVTTSVTFPENGIFNFSLQVTDALGGMDAATAQVTVGNVAPAVTILQAATSNTGLLSGGGLFTDPGADTWSASANYGDGSGLRSLVLNSDQSFSLNHLYTADGSYTLEVCVSDDDGGSGCTQVQVIVTTNRPPITQAGGPYFGFEGSTIRLNASRSYDPDNNIVLYEWDLDNDGQFDDASGGRPDFTALDNGIFAIRVRVTDAGGLSSVDKASVTVWNLPPVITSLSVNNLVRAGSLANAQAVFQDAGVSDTFTATWNWGDGKTSAGTVNRHTVTGLHTYKAPGIYLLTIIVRDKDGGTGLFYKLIVVFPKK